MRKAINAVADFEVYPSVVNKVVEVVLINEVLLDVGELDLGVLGVVEWGCKVVVGDVVGDERFSLSGYDAVEKEFSEVVD